MMPRYSRGRGGGYVDYSGGGGGSARRILDSLSCCPGIVAAYVALHMDSISKILNHILMLALLLDIMLFLSSFPVSFLPTTVGLNVTTISLLLMTQAVLVWLILNHRGVSIASTSCLAPTDFKIGIALGVTVGAVILSFMVSHAFRDTAALCNPFQDSVHRTLTDDTSKSTNATTNSNNNNEGSGKIYIPPEQADATSMTTTTMPMDFIVLCEQRKGSMVSVWFWAGLSFWCNFVSCLLLWVGHAELSESTQYSSLYSMDDGDSRNQQPGRSFVGDYATVPEIRHDTATSHLQNGSGSGSSSQNNSNVPTGYGPTRGIGGYSDEPQLTSV